MLTRQCGAVAGSLGVLGLAGGKFRGPDRAAGGKNLESGFGQTDRYTAPDTRDQAAGM